MPLLYNSDYPDIDANRLNKAKKRINKSSLVQYTKLKQVQSSIQPTKAEMKSYFLQTIQIIDKLDQISSTLIENIFLSIENSQKIIQETEQYLVEQSNFIIYNLTPKYNYFDPQQNQIIKQKLERLIYSDDALGNLANDMIQGVNNIEGEEDLGISIFTYNQNVANYLISPLSELVRNYSPLKINIKPSESGLFEKVEGGYIGGSHHAFYPETRFL